MSFKEVLSETLKGDRRESSVEIYKKRKKKMKHIKLFEDYIAEKVYRLTGIYTSKGLIGKVMQAFKKEIEGIKYIGDADRTLYEVNKAWSAFTKKGEKIIIDEVMKTVKNEEEIVYIHVKGLNGEWEADTVNKLNRPGGPLYVEIPGDFVINIGFADDADASKYSKRLGGSTNTAIPSGRDIWGEMDHEVGYNNIEIRDFEIMMIDAK